MTVLTQPGTVCTLRISCSHVRVDPVPTTTAHHQLQCWSCDTVLPQSQFCFVWALETGSVSPAQAVAPASSSPLLDYGTCHHSRLKSCYCFMVVQRKPHLLCWKRCVFINATQLCTHSSQQLIRILNPLSSRSLVPTANLPAPNSHK